MKVTTLGQVLLSLTTLVTASPAPIIQERQSNSGDGPYGPAKYEVLSSLPRHTIYRPTNVSPAGQMPVFIWGNGACSADGTSARNYLQQIASYGFLVISQGTPGGGGSTTVDRMKEAVTWAANGAGGLFNVNRAKIMVAGYSCGGTEAYEFISDSRVVSIGISNSGYLSNYDLARTIRKPIVFMLGGSGDIAYGNGERDYSYLPSGTPAWKGNLNRVGHGGTYGETNGGLFAKAMTKWALWVLKGDASAAAYFSGNTAVNDGWSNAVSKSLNNIPTGGTTTTTTQMATSTTSAGETPISSPTTTAQRTTTTTGSSTGNCSGMWGQCGGNGWTGATCCSSGSCKYLNDWYSQCL